MAKLICHYSKRFLSFWVWVFKAYMQQNCLAKASVLALTSLFALVPLLMVSISILSMLPVFKSMQGDFQQFILQNMLPSSGEVVNEYLKMFMQNRAGLPITAVVVLFFISIMMMRSLEKVLNDIWQVKKERPLSQAFLLYWAVLSLGPLLVGASLGLSSYLLSWHWLNDGVSRFVNFLQILPFVFNLIAFTFIYQVVPFTRVKLKHAILGGLLMALVFDLAKKAFAWYALNLPTYEMLYGALAIIPLFILWVAISWQLLLLGAIVVRMLSLEPVLRGQGKAMRFELSIKILKVLYEQQKSKRAVSKNELIKIGLDVDLNALDELLALLVKHHYVCITQEQKYVLSCDLATEKLNVLYQNLACFLSLSKDENIELSSLKAGMHKQMDLALINLVI
ncbi:YihY family inner membrane protein [Fastidiosibacter lacustris]|uniref:YihY family inner membrane protein n=1 Tax=Fastidiosibacter lacustris TaxID=2056695 RepID=UPI000E353E54|nr:YihY family inner membrane protein [Fastidiosibacter lacustris]